VSLFFFNRVVYLYLGTSVIFFALSLFLPLHCLTAYVQECIPCPFSRDFCQITDFCVLTLSFLFSFFLLFQTKLAPSTCWEFAPPLILKFEVTVFFTFVISFQSLVPPPPFVSHPQIIPINWVFFSVATPQDSIQFDHTTFRFSFFPLSCLFHLIPFTHISSFAC